MTHLISYNGCFLWRTYCLFCFSLHQVLCLPHTSTQEKIVYITARMICCVYVSATRACGTQSKVECKGRVDEISVDFWKCTCTCSGDYCNTASTRSVSSHWSYHVIIVILTLMMNNLYRFTPTYALINDSSISRQTCLKTIKPWKINNIVSYQITSGLRPL